MASPSFSRPYARKAALAASRPTARRVAWAVAADAPPRGRPTVVGRRFAAAPWTARPRAGTTPLRTAGVPNPWTGGQSTATARPSVPLSPPASPATLSSCVWPTPPNGPCSTGPRDASPTRQAAARCSPGRLSPPRSGPITARRQQQPWRAVDVPPNGA